MSWKNKIFYVYQYVDESNIPGQEPAEFILGRKIKENNNVLA
jgi:hypothetical protein